jgi:hypothetical protein
MNMLTHNVLTWKRRALFFAWFPAFVCFGRRPATAKPVPAALFAGASVTLADIVVTSPQPAAPFRTDDW